MIVDVEPERWTIDPDAVEAAITPRTRAIMPVHLGQQMADMDRLAAIADRHGLALVEDCAHAHGQQWDGRGAGSIGAFGSFSHQSSKTLTAGEGGTLLTGDEAWHGARTRSSTAGGRRTRAERGVHVRRQLPAGRAALRAAVTQLDRFERQRAEREAGARLFEQLADGLTGVCLNPIDPADHALGLLPLPVPDRPGRVRRGDAARRWPTRSRPRAIAAEVQYPPMSRYDLFQPQLSRLPVCVEYADRLDPAGMSFPVAEAAGEREAVYLNESVFRAGRRVSRTS